MSNYKIIKERSPEKLVNNVNYYLNIGYKIAGGVVEWLEEEPSLPIPPEDVGKYYLLPNIYRFLLQVIYKED